MKQKSEDCIYWTWNNSNANDLRILNKFKEVIWDNSKAEKDSTPRKKIIVFVMIFLRGRSTSCSHVFSINWMVVREDDSCTKSCCAEPKRCTRWTGSIIIILLSVRVNQNSMRPLGGLRPGQSIGLSRKGQW